LFTIPLIDLKAQYLSIKNDIDRAIRDVLESSNYVMGPRVKELEEKIALYTGTMHAISCANGTDALILSLHACGIGAGDEVITSPFTFFATAEAISRVGATPVFADVEADTFNIDAGMIQKKITDKTKAIIPVHIFGQPADMDAICDLARKHGLYVIEDACQAIGAGYKGKKAGSLGDVACFSFFPTKNLGAYGDGGMITTNNKKLADIIRALRVHGSGDAGLQAYRILRGDNGTNDGGRDNKPGTGKSSNDGSDINPGAGKSSYDGSESNHHAGDNGHSRLSNTSGPTASCDSQPTAFRDSQPTASCDSQPTACRDSVFDITKYYNYITGYNSRLDELQAAILLVKLKHLDEWNEKRRETAAYYSSRLQNPKLAVQRVIEGAKSVYHMFVLRSDQRDLIAGHLKSNGISTGIYYPVPLHLQKAFEYLGYARGSLPVCEYLAERTLAIPVYPELTGFQKEYIIDRLLEVIV